MGWDSLSNSKYSHRLMYLLIFLYFTKVLLCKRTFITQLSLPENQCDRNSNLLGRQVLIFQRITSKSSAIPTEELLYLA